MNKLTKTKIAMSIVGAVVTLGVASAANATPMLQIVGSGGGAPLTAYQEAIGDPGGTNYANGPTAGPSGGPGQPTALGGWPVAPSFAPDPSFGGNLGISGYDGSYLDLTQAGNVTFQFTGKGDSVDHNQFQVNTGSGWTTIWDSQPPSASNGTCGGGSTTPNCLFPLSQQTFYFGAGLIDFQFVNLTTGTPPNPPPAIATNDGLNNPKDVAAGYFLGIDPYLTTTQFDTTGSAAYAAFTDRSCIPGGACDHDYEDLVVRVSVPEPGSMFLLGAGLLGLAFGRRRLLS